MRRWGAAYQRRARVSEVGRGERVKADEMEGRGERSMQPLLSVW